MPNKAPGGPYADASGTAAVDSAFVSLDDLPLDDLQTLLLAPCQARPSHAAVPLGVGHPQFSRDLVRRSRLARAAVLARMQELAAAAGGS